MARTTILLDDDLLLEVKHVAKQNRTTATEVIKLAVKAYVARKPQGKLPIFTAIGKGRGDLGENTERILRKAASRRREW